MRAGLDAIKEERIGINLKLGYASGIFAWNKVNIFCKICN